MTCFLCPFSSYLLVIVIILIMTGNIHINPGLSSNSFDEKYSFNDLSILHRHVRSLRSKIDLVDAEFGENDIQSNLS